MVKTRTATTMESVDPNLYKNLIKLTYPLSFPEINSKCEVC